LIIDTEIQKALTNLTKMSRNEGYNAPELDAPQDAFLMEQLLEELVGSPSEDERSSSAPTET